MVTDSGSLTDDNASTVVDEEVLADMSASTDIDTRGRVGDFGHHTRDDGHAQVVEHVRNAIHVDGVQARVGEDDLLLRAGRRVTVVERLHVGEQRALDFGQGVEKLLADISRLLANGVTRATAAQVIAATDEVVTIIGGVGERQNELLAQHRFNVDKRLTDEVAGARGRRQHLRPEIAGEQHAAQLGDEPLDSRAAGEAAAGLGEEDLVRLVVLLDGRDDAL